jgi:hypothetical protein
VPSEKENADSEMLHRVLLVEYGLARRASNTRAIMRGPFDVYPVSGSAKPTREKSVLLGLIRPLHSACETIFHHNAFVFLKEW